MTHILRLWLSIGTLFGIIHQQSTRWRNNDFGFDSDLIVYWEAQKFLFFMCKLAVCYVWSSIFSPLSSQVTRDTDDLIASVDLVCVASRHPVNHSPVILFKQSAYCVDFDVISLTKAPLGRLKWPVELSASQSVRWRPGLSSGQESRWMMRWRERLKTLSRGVWVTL